MATAAIEMAGPPVSAGYSANSPEAVAACKVEMARPKKYKFQVMGGWHAEPGILVDDHDREFVGDVKYGPGRPAGDIVDTDINLAKRFNHPGSIKFKRLDESGNPLAGELQEHKLKAQKASALYAKALEGMSQRQLIDHAEKEKVELKNETVKEKIVKILLDAAARDIG